MYQLGELIEIIKGHKAPNTLSEFKPGTHRYIQIEDLRPGSLPKYTYDKSATLATKNDVLIAWDGANAGTVGFSLEGYPGSTIAILKPKNQKIYGPFLGYFLRSQFRYIQDNCTGATIPHVNRNSLENLWLQIPSTGEQKRITTLLEKADRLRRLRKYVLELSDTYLQSVFLEMFGDPVTNSKGWEIRSLRSISLKFSDGPFGSNLKTEHYTSSGIRVLRLQNVGIGQLVDNDKAYISEAHFATLNKYHCIPGDIIVGTLGDPNLRACILPSSIPAAINKADCVQIRVNPDEAIAEYICGLLNMPHTLFLATGMIHGQTRDRINMGRLAQLEVPIPPLPLQQKFAQIVQKHERLRAQQREAERQAEHLFQTLLHKAFQCELSLDEDEMLMSDVERVHQPMPAVADVIEPIDTEGAFQLALPME